MNAIRKELSQYDYLIWDWNGTLLNDVDLAVGIISDLLMAQGKPPLSRKEYLAKFRFPVRDYYAEIGFDFSRNSFEELARQFIERFHTEVIHCPLHEGVPQLLQELRTDGFNQSVLSASHQDSLHAQLRHHGIFELFDHAYGLSDHHAAGKIERGKELIQQFKMNPKRTLLIGDTDHDLEVANALGIEALLLGDGHQCPTRLEAIHPRVLRSRH